MCCCGKGGCPQWPDRCCLCFSRKGGVVLTGILTILDNICIILLCTYARINEEFWSEGYNMVEKWVLNNHWDTKISQYALAALGSINANRKIFLSAITAYSCLAIFNSVLMITGVCLRGMGMKRNLLLPWLICDFLTISFTFLVFITWAFLSFFVHVLVAILFPIFAGAILGLHIYLWRNVKDVYLSYGEEDPSVKLVVGANNTSSMYTMLNANNRSSARRT